MRKVLALLPAMLLAIAPAVAAESDFLQGIEGEWQGEGSARRTADSGPVGINCQVSADSSASSFSFDGTCRALAIVRQSLSGSLNNTSGASYEGTYVGPKGGRSALSGERNGNVIDLQVAWAEEVNGDTAARMQLEMPSPDTMIIRTIDKSPTTGASVVTSEVTLARQ